MHYAIVTIQYDAMHTLEAFYRQAARLMEYKAAANYAAATILNQRKAGETPYIEVYNNVGFRGYGSCGYSIIATIGGQPRYSDDMTFTPEAKYIMVAIKRAWLEPIE